MTDDIQDIYRLPEYRCPAGYPLRKREWAELGDGCGKQCETCPVNIRDKKDPDGQG